MPTGLGRSAIFKDEKTMKTHNSKLEIELRQAIEERDMKRIGQLIDRLRFGNRANYNDCFKLATNLTGISLDEWDEVLHEVDKAEEDE